MFSTVVIGREDTEETMLKKWRESMEKLPLEKPKFIFLNINTSPYIDKMSVHDLGSNQLNLMNNHWRGFMDLSSEKRMGNRLFKKYGFQSHDVFVKDKQIKTVRMHELFEKFKPVLRRFESYYQYSLIHRNVDHIFFEEKATGETLVPSLFIETCESLDEYSKNPDFMPGFLDERAKLCPETTFRNLYMKIREDTAFYSYLATEVRASEFEKKYDEANKKIKTLEEENKKMQGESMKFDLAQERIKKLEDGNKKIIMKNIELQKQSAINKSEASRFEKLYSDLRNSIKALLNIDQEDRFEHVDECSLCMEAFNTEARHKSCLSCCGHQACYRCFWKILGSTKSHQAKCPMCKKLFSDQNIIKLS